MSNNEKDTVVFSIFDYIVSTNELYLFLWTVELLYTLSFLLTSWWIFLWSNHRAKRVWLVPGFSPKKLEYFQNIFFHLNENKIVINFNCYFCFVQKLIWAIEIAFEIRQVHKRFIKLSITLLFWHKGLGFKFSLHLEGSSLLRLYFRF